MQWVGTTHPWDRQHLSPPQQLLLVLLGADASCGKPQLRFTDNRSRRQARLNRSPSSMRARGTSEFPLRSGKTGREGKGCPLDHKGTPRPFSRQVPVCSDRQTGGGFDLPLPLRLGAAGPGAWGQVGAGREGGKHLLQGRVPPRGCSLRSPPAACSNSLPASVTKPSGKSAPCLQGVTEAPRPEVTASWFCKGPKGPAPRRPGSAQPRT